MTYITSRGHVSVPEDLWDEMMQAAEQLLELQAYAAAVWSGPLMPEQQQIMQSNNEWAAVVQRARELDARHRDAQYEAGRSTREQIERGGGGGPYEV
jgi:hypothetical protein